MTVLIIYAMLLAVGPAAAHTGSAQAERVIDGGTIREGYATAIRTFPYAWRRKFLQLEAEARRAQRGRWANETHTAS